MSSAAMEPENSPSHLSMLAKYPRSSKRGLDLIKPPPVSKEDFLRSKALIPRIRRSRRIAVPRLLEDRERQQHQPQTVQERASDANPAIESLPRNYNAEQATNQASCTEAARKPFEDAKNSPLSDESLCLEEYLARVRKTAQVSTSPKSIKCRTSSGDAEKYPKKHAMEFQGGVQTEAQHEQRSPLDPKPLTLGHENNSFRQTQQVLTSASVSTDSPKRPRESKNRPSPHFNNFQVQEDDADEEDHECPAPKRQRPQNQKTYKTKARDIVIQESQDRRASRQKQSNHVIEADTDESTREESCKPKAKKKKQPRRLRVDELEIISERFNNEGSGMNEEESAELSQDPISQKSIDIEPQPQRSNMKLKIKVRGNGGISTIDVSEFRFPKPQNLSPRSRRRLQQTPTYSDGFEGKEADPIGRTMPIGHRKKTRERCTKIEVKIAKLTLVAERYFEGEPSPTYSRRRPYLQGKQIKRITFAESHQDEFDRDEALTFDAQDEPDMDQVIQKSNVQPLPRIDERRNRLETTQTTGSGNSILHNPSPLGSLERKQLHSHQVRATSHIQKDQSSILATPQKVTRLPSRQDKCNEKPREAVKPQTFKRYARSDISALQELSMVSMPKIVNSSESNGDSDEDQHESSDGIIREDSGGCGREDGREESGEEHLTETEERSNEDLEQKGIEHPAEGEEESDRFLEEEEEMEHRMEEDEESEEHLDEDEVHHHTKNAEESDEPLEKEEEVAHHTEAEEESNKRFEEEETEHHKKEPVLQELDCSSVGRIEIEDVGGNKSNELCVFHESEKEEEANSWAPGRSQTSGIVMKGNENIFDSPERQRTGTSRDDLRCLSSMASQALTLVSSRTDSSGRESPTAVLYRSQGSTELGDTQKFVIEMSPPCIPETQLENEDAWNDLEYSQQTYLPSSNYFSRAPQQLQQTPTRRPNIERIKSMPMDTREERRVTELMTGVTANTVAFKHTVSPNPIINRHPTVIDEIPRHEKSLRTITRQASYGLGTIPSSVVKYRKASLPFNPPLRKR